MWDWARPPGPRMAKLIRSLAPFTLPMAGWAKVPVATSAPVAAPAVSRKPRRDTSGLLVMLFAPGLRDVQEKRRNPALDLRPRPAGHPLPDRATARSPGGPIVAEY